MFGSKPKKLLAGFVLLASMAACNTDQKQAIELEKRGLQSITNLEQAMDDNDLINDWTSRFNILKSAEIQSDHEWSELGTEVALIAESDSMAAIFSNQYNAEIVDLRTAYRTLHNWLHELRDFQDNANSIDSFQKFNHHIFSTVQRVDRIKTMYSVLQTLPVDIKPYIAREVTATLEIINSVDERLNQNYDSGNMNEVQTYSTGKQAKDWLNQVLDYIN
jgi:DNA mismatch repair ATPase MutS